jgi:hypothetical protein
VTGQTFTLDPLQSKDVYMTFDLKQGSKGDQQFLLQVSANGQAVSEKPVVISIASGSFWSNLSENINWEIVGIVALNLILLIAIIVVAVKILKRK